MTLDEFIAFTVTVTPQSVLWKYTVKLNLMKSTMFSMDDAIKVFEITSEKLKIIHLKLMCISSALGSLKRQQQMHLVLQLIIVCS